MRHKRLRLVLAWSWAALLVVCTVFGIKAFEDDTRFDTRVTALLPETRQNPLIDRANDQLGKLFADRFVLLVEADDLQGATAALAEALDQSSAIESLRWRPDDFINANVFDVLGPYRYRLIDDATRTHIESGETATLRDEALRQLFSPTGIKPDPLHDPFGLLQHWLTRQMPQIFSTHDNLVTVEAGTAQSHDERRAAVIIATLAGNPYDMKVQHALSETLDTFSAAHPDVRLLHSGLVFHATDGARQAKREISTLGLGALIGLIALLLVVFRSPLTLATLLLPLAGGGLFAFALTSLLFDSIHLLTIAFGTSLIGVAIDYAIHLQCARATQGERFSLRHMLPGLTLGLISSVLAYLAQALTPMPGLTQMALFATFGLIGAWLTVVLWLPLWRVRPSQSADTIANRLWRLFETLRGRLGVKSALLLAAVALLTIFVGLKSDDSLRLINTSSPTLLSEEGEVQSLLGRDTGTLYLLVTASSAEAWLEKAERLTPQFDTLISQGHLGSYASLTQQVPSATRQDANLRDVRTLYRRELPMLYQQAGLPEALVSRAMNTLDDVPRLTIDAWLASPLGESDRRLWLGDDEHGGVAGVIVFSGAFDAEARQAMTTLDSDSPDIEFVDRVDKLSTILGELRREIAGWVALALAVVTLLLIVRYRRRTWRVIAPAAGALLVVLASYAVSGVSLNLFHQLALLLVLGIGLDAGIFATEHPGARHAWLAITLSTISSLLAFGLLAFSATQVLHHIGMTALIGLLAVWLLVPLVQPRLPVHLEPDH
ncbi:MMPL family transporter [Phytohalomonas tamaricis]|uniref:MMPL family transporter n=1 Tax=Phytohalomonas tamaricis TaxID=2081032 RepID=UPI0021D40171|nr:MMPL family transporter [Phytohalomonas tamaricis]